MSIVSEVVWESIVEIIIFLILTVIGGFLFKKIIEHSGKLSKIGEVLPEDEIHTLKQVFYLLMMSLAFIDILYSLITESGLFYFAIFDIALSLFLAIRLDKSTLKGKLILLLLVPFNSLNLMIFYNYLITYIGWIHVLIFIYFVKVYYDKFREYTESHGLSVTILVLFVIVFFSFILTQIVEGVNPLDSLVMVSNAFTSNGYAILGNSIAGKINEIILVWAGYILSGVGAASLTAAILTRNFNHRFDELEELIKNNGISDKTDDEDS